MRARQRDLSVDLFRVLAVVVVVLGHWLAASLTYRNGRFGDENVLAGVPWTRWLTLFFQVIPLLFLVAGYANAASWDHRGDDRWPDWLRRRVSATLGPATAYVAVVLIAVAVCLVSHVDGQQLEYAASAVALHLWFLPVYLVLVSLTPVMVAAQRRWGWAAPAALAAAVAVVDAATLGGRLPLLGWANYLLGWAAVYQLGVAWLRGALRGRLPRLLAVGGAATLAVLIRFGPYPLSMVAVPGETVRNTSPPTVALLAFSVAQAGLVAAVAPTLNRRLAASRWRHPLAAVNNRVMGLYLWHMIPVVLVALAAYPAGLLPQPVPGTAGWWLSRAVWVALLTAVTAIVLALLAVARAHFGGRLSRWSPGWPVWLSRPLLVLGAATAAYALFRFTVGGFAPRGRFPVTSTLLYFAGAALLGRRDNRHHDVARDESVHRLS
ncbi:acyltransferase [Amycolatopsis sp. K13G38]|uniref:Acyltransferase n=1 Tax=Amycolatopsis acididurans TaxID=2724524 RepID=A0ABX1J8C5_9PSEU|nr:acyltransferase family protein [Amycolatopsis acididurans]NKQ56037.1 acyltransferase [Amycolatopsis acididurans]